MTLETVLRELRERVPLSPWEPHPLRGILGEERIGRKLLMREILEALGKAIRDRDEVDVVDLLLVATEDGLDASYAEILGTLLKADFHREHEGVVTALEEVGDPETVEVLYETALRIPDWDDFRSLAKKCILALKAIGTEEAMQRLRDLSGCEDAILRESARGALVD
jgi:hypothetical protein